MLICDLRRLCVLEIVQSDTVLQKVDYCFFKKTGSGLDFCYTLYIIDKCLY